MQFSLAAGIRRLFRWRRFLPWLGTAAIAAVLAIHYFFPFNEGRLRESDSNGALLVLDRDGGMLGWRAGRDGCWRLPGALAAVSPQLLAATVAAEDKRFYSHSGVDFLALARAVRQNLTHARRISGASTLTMQTIRLLYPRSRTYITKIREIFSALQLEKIADKTRILQTYCNLAPYGGNVIGAQAAALRYFGKPASALTLGEAALLAGIPQSPTRFNPRKHLRAALKRREFVLTRMTALNFITAEQAERARAENITIADSAALAENGAKVPGLVDWIAQTHPAGGICRSAIVPEIQDFAGAAAQAHFRRLRALGVDGLAVVVIDVEKSALTALVGNPAPDDPRSGQINGALIRRPPGSLLKPFIYALAYQQGICTPDTLLEDSPRNWDGYRPENMDRQYLGKISAAAALRLSRNIPAVTLLEAVGVEPAAALLRTAGLTLPPPEKLGLSLALGTPEMRLADVANAYAALARLGIYRRLRLTSNDTEDTARQTLSPAAAWLALRSLAPKETPDSELNVVWKTGTSWRHRDAWAVAISPRYAAAVWTGNWSGAGNEKLTGAETALPLAQTLISKLADGQVWLRPAGVCRRTVCAVSGALPGIHCTEKRQDDALSGVSPAAVCTLCMTEQNKHRKLAEPDAAEPRLAIVSPAAAEYFLAPGAPATLALQAEAAAGAVIWYIDGKEIARTAPGAIHLWPLAPGAHTATAVAADGRAGKVAFTVRKLD